MKLSIIIDVVVEFVAEALTKFGTATDWEKVRKNLHVKVAAMVPGEIADAFVIACTDKVLDIIVVVVKNEVIFKAIMQDLADGKFKEVIAHIVDAVKAEIH
jgi:hypothetical protein